MPSFRTMLGVTPSVLLIVLLWILIRVRAHREFSWFVGYVGFAVCADIARFVTRNQQATYFFVYWGTEAAYAVFGVLVLYQVFQNVFRNLSRIWYIRLLFPVLVIFAVML